MARSYFLFNFDEDTDFTGLLRILKSATLRGSWINFQNIEKFNLNILSIIA